MIRVLVVGDFWNRQPLAYPAIAKRVAGRIALVDEAAEAQIVLFGHSHDLVRHGWRIAEMRARFPRLRAVLLSEEPFWDSCWSADPFAPLRLHDVGAGVVLPYAVLNHHTAPFFNATAIPYFLLTDPRYIAHYRPLFARNAGKTPADWDRQFREAPVAAAFVAEKRTLPVHAPAFPSRHVWGLSLFRTRLARHCKGAEVLRLGRGWSGDSPRQEQPDWHADKLAQLDLRCRYVSGVENTHQRNYVTEKIYDALAVGAIPLYVADAGHHVRRLIGAKGWVNLFDQLDRGAAARVGFGPAKAFDAGRLPGAGFARDYAAVQGRLARLFEDDAAADAERDRLADGLVAALHRLLV